ncbi:MAG: spore germination protein [Lawsonibacter sp.]|nr:spore germination protein [Lawsonibacter sp.]
MPEPLDRGPHPRQEPRIPLPLSLENLEQVFENCDDFKTREVFLHGDPSRQVTVCYVDGQARSERLNDYVLRPLAQDPMLASVPEGRVFELLEKGALYAQAAQRQTEMDPVVLALIDGACALFLPGRADALTVPVATEEKRSVGEPENEPALKGARDSFVESVRTNTSLVRRRLRAPELKVKEHVVGRQSLTPVDVVWLEGIADKDTVRRLEERLDQIDIDGVEAAGNLEEYLADTRRSPFPLLPYTQRPDRFCQGLLEGRVGLLCDGIPLGWLAPGTIDQFFKTGQDRAYHWMVASALSLIRYLCALITLLLPGLYIALVTFHPEAIPVKLALSIVAAKQEVPFSTIFEVLIMLLAFEVIQEAGLRLPGPIGATVSILGGLVVGNAAVDAHIVSPAVLIAVAIAGVAGYTQPSQDFGNALRLWRFLLAILASAGGLLGLALGCASLLYHLAGLETFGVPYLAPFTTGAGAPRGHPSLFRLPLPAMRWRDGAVHTRNRRNQR